MNRSAILQAFARSLPQKKLEEAIALPQGETWVKGLYGSAFSFVIANAFKKVGRPFLLVLSDKEEAAYYLNDLEELLGEKQVLFYPGSYRRPYQLEKTDNANVLLRAEVLNRINYRRKPVIIVSYPDALFEKVVTRKELEKSTLRISLGDALSLDFVNEMLFEYRFKRVDFVSEPGEFSVRGGILDVFSYSHDEPYRIEFFGDEVDSIRTFDVETQLSLKHVKKISLLPNVADKVVVESRESFVKYLSSRTVVFSKDLPRLCDRLDILYQKAEEAYAEQPNEVDQLPPETLFSKGNEVRAQLKGYTYMGFEDQPNASPDAQIVFATQPQPSFNKQFDLVVENLSTYHNQGYTNYLVCANNQQAQRLHDIFDEIACEVSYRTPVFPLYQGFVSHDAKIVCYTDHQIFGRYHRFHLRNGYAKKQAITLKELNTLKKGDYVTHIDHGIGTFGGLQKIEVEGKCQEAIKLLYGDRDVLYVSIHSLHKISKYNGKDGAVPRIYRLGSKAWQNLKQKTKKRVKQIAFSLIELYAKRRLRQGYRYEPDSYLQHELEASFLYEDTPDQSKATEDIKHDMESEQPMDRLICGDVGFGKTEIAIRAAFKAVDNNKQVAVLVPTTILAFQHYRTFGQRLKDLPVNVDYLNRFRTTKEKRTILERLSQGKLDIVIGTHLLVNQYKSFKDLGLLIVDEEQKFGVAVKEKLKSIKENVDVLTLTATPIPRTLQFSLMAARDLSIINTPPPNRYPIESSVVSFGEELIRDAISYEIQRGGQVFFVHNRIENIQEVAGMIQRLVPDARMGMGHGQMEGKKLEKVMLSFINGGFDVLVSTTIIENGLDVPNANTIFINNAHHFGLSDLHQMRGRVGRSNKKAFCYFITPPYSALTPEARKRMQALEQFTDLGSGFQIAMKDLEIRGAGDLLGAEQSGIINEMGFDTYQKILSEAIAELKENEFKALYQEEEEKRAFVEEVQLDTDITLLFPDTYVNNISERLVLYNELSEIKEEEQLYQFEMNLRDRFGAPPLEALDLLNSVRIKWIAELLGWEKVVLKGGKLIGYFIEDQQSPFYQSDAFAQLLSYVQQHPSVCKMKERKTRYGLRLLLIFDKAITVDQALALLNPIQKLLLKSYKQSTETKKQIGLPS